MDKAYWAAGAWLCGLLATSCGSAPQETGSEKSADEAREGLDAACTVSVGGSGGNVTPVDGGYLYASANGSCADGSPLEFLFSAKDPRNKPLLAQNFQPYGQAFWQLPPGAKEGTYSLTVEARRGGSVDIVAKASRKQVLGRVCLLGGVALDPSFAQPGEPITVSAFLQCPPDTTGQWNATISKPGGGSMTLPWTTNPTAIWDTTGLLPGTATVQISVRNLGNTVADATSKVTYALGNTCSVAALVASGTGQSRRLDATATCTGNATPSFAFSSVAPDGTATLLRDFSDDSGFDWNTTGLDGTFSARVDVRAEQSPTQPLTTKSIKVPLGDACTKVTLADTWGAHRRTEALSLVASAPCGAAELSFQVRSARETAWTTVCPYSSNTNCPLDLSALPAGDYVARALVRKSGSIAVSDAASAARDFVLMDDAALLRGLPGTPNGYGQALSPDGRWVVGSGSGASGVFRWSRTTGYIELPGLATNVYSASADAVSNGGVVVGALPSSQWQINQAVLWNGSNITQLLPPAGYATVAAAISADGKVAVGASGVGAFRWTSKSGLVNIGSNFAYSGAEDVSADGNVVVGYANTGSRNEATRWTAQTGMVALGLLPGCTWSEARSISQDGKVIVGDCGGPGVSLAYRWTAEDGMQDLGASPGGAALIAAFSTNGDGNVIVGNVVIDNNAVAVIWTPDSGIRFLADVLRDSGTDLADWQLEDADDISSDGKTIIGYGNRGTFLITLP